MESKAKHLYVRLANDRIMCSCPLEEYKICSERVKNAYNCIEAIVRVSPIERGGVEISQQEKRLDAGLTKLGKALRDATKHFLLLKG